MDDSTRNLEPLRTHESYRMGRRVFMGLLAGMGLLLSGGRLEAEPKINGVAYTTLKTIGKQLGLRHKWVQADRHVMLSASDTKLSMEVNKRDIQVNGIRVYLGFPVAMLNGDLAISTLDYEKTLQALLLPHRFKPVPRLVRIAIDAGHGGKDPGAQNKSLKLVEKQLTYDLSKRLQKLLTARGFTISLLRTKDEFIALEKRTLQANSAKADFFVSLHFNAANETTVRGVETYAYTPVDQPSTSRSKVVADDRTVDPAHRHNPWNTLAAFYIQRAMADQLETEDRGMKRARFTVLKGLNCPGVLVEGGFLTHATEGRNLASTAYRERLARAIAEGIVAYQNTLKRAASKT